MTEPSRPPPDHETPPGASQGGSQASVRPARWRRALGLCASGLLGVWIVFGLAIVVLQQWVLPRVSEYRGAVAQVIGEAIGERVTIGALEAEWRGLHPLVGISELRFYDPAGTVVFELPRVSASVSWRSLLALDLRLNSLVLESPALRVGRDRDGAFFVAGVAMDGVAPASAGLRNWLMRQGDVLLTSGRVDWVDERRGAPVLALRDVQFRLRNRLGARHEFALRASPPEQLASTIDVRGQFRGNDLDDFDHWSGDLYARFDRIDLAAWTPWVDYPAEVQTGAGALTAWITIQDSRLLSATADLSLEQVRVQVSPDMPRFDLAHLRGRLSGRTTGAGRGLRAAIGPQAPGYRFEASGLSVQPIGGEATDHVDIVLDWREEPEDTRREQRREQAGAEGSNLPAGRGTLRVNRIDLAALVPLAGAMPLPQAVRAWLAEATPRGVLTDFESGWSGRIDTPAIGQLGMRFSGLALRAHDGLPGFDHLDGRLDLDEGGGRLTARGAAVHMTAPFLLPQAPSLQWDRLAIDLSWEGNLLAASLPSQVRIGRAQLANGEFSLEAAGRWSAIGTPAEMLDVGIEVPRAELRTLSRYLPGLQPELLEWLRGSLQAGSMSAGVIRLSGNPRELRGGAALHGLRVDARARVGKAAVRFSPEWPLIDEVSGILTLRERELTFGASEARTTSVAIHDALIRVPDLASTAPELMASGYADGETRELLRYLGATPLADTIAGPLRGMTIDGRARLDLRLEVPLSDVLRTRARGAVALYANRVQIAAEVPRLTELTGRVDFTEQGMAAEGRGRFLDAPVSVSVLPGKDDEVLVTARGSATVRDVAALWPFPLASHLQGQAAYRAQARLRPAAVELTIDSDLIGVEFALPAPLRKGAAEPLALHARQVFGRAPLAGTTVGSEGGGTLELSLGDRLSLVARFAPDAAADGGDRIGVAVGRARATLPDQAGLSVDAVLDAIDLDPWRGLLGVEELSGQAVTRASPPVIAAPGLIQLRAQSLTAFGRVLHEARLRARPTRTGWSLAVASVEASGELDWNPQGQGRLAGRFSHLTVPDRAPVATPIVPRRVGSSAPVSTLATDAGTAIEELPGMAISADQFSLGGHELGRLALEAANEPTGWQIRQLEVVAPEGAVRASGLWRHLAGVPEVDVAVDVSFTDAGRYLARLGQAGAISGAAGALKGNLRWRGVPYAVDFPSLSGQLSLRAGQGQFLHVEPGMGRLLGVLSLQALPRRIALDFHDVFSDGFAFDQIEATGIVDRGVLLLREFRMGGPAASVQLSGTLDLANETQNLHAQIIPELRDSLAAVAGIALVNPLVGLGTFIAQRLLYDPFGRLFSYDYDITGAWRDPQVSNRASAAGSFMAAPPRSGVPAESAPAGAAPTGAAPSGSASGRGPTSPSAGRSAPGESPPFSGARP